MLYESIAEPTPTWQAQTPTDDPPVIGASTNAKRPVKAIDFGESIYFLSKKNEGENNNWQEIELQGTLCAGCIRTYSANMDGYNNSYGFDSDFEHQIFGLLLISNK